MSTNPHLRKIGEAVEDIRRWVPVRSVPYHEDIYAASGAILTNAEAMATALAASEARVARWKRYALALRAYDDAGTTPARDEAIVEYEEALDDLKAHGDLPAEEDHDG